MNIAILAAVSMLFQDVVGVLMVQAEARDHGWIAGLCDSAMWLFAIATTTFSVTTLQGHDLHEKIIVVTAVTVANLVGSRLGVLIGKKYIKEAIVCTCCKIHNLGNVTQ